VRSASVRSNSDHNHHDDDDYYDYHHDDYNGANGPCVHI